MKPMRAASSLTLRNGQVLANRIAKAAMSERLGDAEGAPTEGLERLYTRWSAGGAALLITGNVMIDSAHRGEPHNVVLEDDRHLPAFERWAAAAKQFGSRCWMQINHPGRQAPRSIDPAPVAPSAIPMRGMMGAFRTPRALTTQEVENTLDRFARTAELAERAGFDGVQIHAAHGYLISQFLSPLTNTREDRFGITPENRRAFLLECVERVRDRTQPGFAVSVKLNSADFQRGGFDTSDSMAVAEALDAANIELLEISGGTYERPEMFEAAKASTRAREAFFLEYATQLRDRYSGHLMLTGGIRSRTGIRAALELSKLDVVGLARPLAIEPDLPRRLLDGSAESAIEAGVHTRFARLDRALAAPWHELQLHRMAAGEPPDPDLSAFRTLRWYLADHLYG